MLNFLQIFYIVLFTNGSRCSFPFLLKKPAKATADRSAFYQIFQKHFKGLCLTKYHIILIKSFPFVSADLEEVQVPNITQGPCQKYREFCNDEGELFRGLLTDYQKHVIVYLMIFQQQRYTHGFDCMSLKLIYSYLKQRKQRTKVGTPFCSWKDLLLEFYNRTRIYFI